MTIGTHIALTTPAGKSACVPVDAIDVIEEISGGTKVWMRAPSPVNFVLVTQTPTEVLKEIRETYYLLKPLADHRAKELA